MSDYKELKKKINTLNRVITDANNTISMLQLKARGVQGALKADEELLSSVEVSVQNKKEELQDIAEQIRARNEQKVIALAKIETINEFSKDV